MRVSKEQQERLMKLGFVWDLPKHHWEKKFELLKKYKEEHGDCLVPPRLEDPKYKGASSERPWLAHVEHSLR